VAVFKEDFSHDDVGEVDIDGVVAKSSINVVDVAANLPIAIAKLIVANTFSPFD